MALAVGSLSIVSQQPPEKPVQTLAERTAHLQHLAGLLPLDYDAKTGKLYLEVPLTANGNHTRSQEFIYTLSLPHGIGSNDLGFDRGQIGGVGEGGASTLVYFERSGPKVLLMQPNERFRSSAADPAEQASVRESFAESVKWGFKVEAESPDGTVLLDATDFFVRDARGIAEGLTAQHQGAYKMDAARSALVMEATKAFPRNVVVEALITLASEGPARGRYVRDVAPDPRSIAVHQRQMFVQLPDPGFTPRRYSPRAGYFSAEYRDYSTPLGEPLDQQFITRHRLLKADPRCTHACAAVAPIQYYVDRGAPEMIRAALVEGARWWDQAFQAAGWAPGTFRVDPLPADADPMDVRYNIIQWVHRYSRGWSYGAEIADPRTGEIIKGNVTLGSLRGRQDYLIAEALLSPYAKGKSFDAAHDPMLQMVLQRIRQLAAHETGHTLGLSHNFAASSFPHTPDESVSVMDYPHPYVTLNAEGVPDLSHAYAVNIGQWDKVAIDYGYREFDRGGERVEDAAALDAILLDSEKKGLVYITDEDARPFGGAHPHAHLWDNGTDATAELNRVLEVRAAALKRFSENAIRPGTPMAQLADTLVPLYLFHRYQTEAAIKLIGGVDYRYNVRGDGQMGPVIVGLKEQDAALAAVLKTLTPEALTLPESILRLLPPVPPEYHRTQESLPSETSPTFDPIAAAEAAADLTLQVLFDPARASRLLQFHMRDTADGSKGPSLRVMMEKVSKTTAERPESGHSISSEVERAVEFRGLEAMLALAINPAASTQARAIARYHIADLLHQWTTTPPPADSAESIHRTAMVDRIQDFLRDPMKFVPAKPVEAPPGMPIGDDEE